MKSLLNKRLPGILAVGLVALAVGAASASASASLASASGLTPKQAKKKKAALKKCNKKKKSKRHACKKNVNKKYAKIAKGKGGTPPPVTTPTPPAGATHNVSLEDMGGYNHFDPATIDIKVNDLIKWSWADVQGYEPHNVTLGTGPAGVSRNDFVSQTTAVNSYTFTRQFTEPGNYHFSCSIHVGMDLDVTVSK